MTEGCFFDPDLLDGVAETYGKSFATAAPFPHVVVDGLFPQQAVDDVLKEFPEPSARSDWIRLYDETSAKLAMSHDWTMGPSTRHLLNQFNSAAFVNFLEQLTGIEGLIPDPHYGGGGLHQMERGGFLKVHADFNRHGSLGLDRRLNVLLYLNRDWDDGWGGQLELWDTTMASCVQRISPVFNRLVIFATTALVPRPTRPTAVPAQRDPPLTCYLLLHKRSPRTRTFASTLKLVPATTRARPQLASAHLEGLDSTTRGPH